MNNFSTMSNFKFKHWVYISKHVSYTVYACRKSQTYKYSIYTDKHLIRRVNEVQKIISDIKIRSMSKPNTVVLR